MHYDVFICHASEDKEDFVRPLAKLLQQQHIEVWYDEFSLKIGDSLTQKIDEGLSNSSFGIVVLSPNFFKKPWAKRELNGLTLREMVEQKNLILPIWHRVTMEELRNFLLH
ncbi:toll/interleukin-1 receptor domain-containing protein [Autumnicola edwardsiae]|uniref:Toll/interleukin-1 receptor domain-containing protein n=1 Tax=Autumnicola edwardsiae TaxID=3075594 RepID=A0ABU3CY62_9FLAO|nr:toll/interleukin-1 receptor domain-containing protein [Zunongwangia sp. F297]MDT0651300.1 toll/interleukin-1 receptor domain-containing protein [Zunongwangia sp. F297]